MAAKHLLGYLLCQTRPNSLRCHSGQNKTGFTAPGAFALASADQITETPKSIWDVPSDTEVSVGWRHLVVMFAVVGIGVLVGVLGTFSFPIGDVPTGFMP